MKIKYFIKHLKVLLILPFICSCFAGQIHVIEPQPQPGDITDFAASLVQSTRAGVTLSIPYNATYTSLSVYTQLEGTVTPVKVGTISGIVPNTYVAYTIPGLIPNMERRYLIIFVDPANEVLLNTSKDASDFTSSAEGTVYIDTEFNLAHSETWVYGWAMNQQIADTLVFAGGYSDNQPLGLGAAALHNLSSSSLISPFGIVVITPDTFNGSLGQTGFPYDFNEDGSLELVVGDPFWGDPQNYPRCGEVSYFDTIPTVDTSITSAVRNYGPHPVTSLCNGNVKNQLSRELTYDPDTQILLAACPGCSYGEAPCNNQNNCGACAAYDMSSGLNYLGLIQKRGDPLNNISETCQRVLFVDLNGNGTNDLVYQYTDDAAGTGCIQLNYVADGMTEQGVQVFLEPSGCSGTGNIMQLNLDVNQDGIDDLVLLKFAPPPTAFYDLTVILGSSSFDPSSYTSYNYTGDVLGGFPLMIDSNNDGLEDFTIMNQDSWLLWLDAATADLSGPPDYIVPIEAGFFAVKYDVNGDGYMDIIRSDCNVINECRMYIMY